MATTQSLGEQTSGKSKCDSAVGVNVVVPNSNTPEDVTIPATTPETVDLTKEDINSNDDDNNKNKSKSDVDADVTKQNNCDNNTVAADDNVVENKRGSSANGDAHTVTSQDINNNDSDGDNKNKNENDAEVEVTETNESDNKTITTNGDDAETRNDSTSIDAQTDNAANAASSATTDQVTVVETTDTSSDGKCDDSKVGDSPANDSDSAKGRDTATNKKNNDDDHDQDKSDSNTSPTDTATDTATATAPEATNIHSASPSFSPDNLATLDLGHTQPQTPAKPSTSSSPLPLSKSVNLSQRFASVLYPIDWVHPHELPLMAPIVAVYKAETMYQHSYDVCGYYAFYNAVCAVKLAYSNGDHDRVANVGMSFLHRGRFIKWFMGVRRFLNKPVLHPQQYAAVRAYGQLDEILEAPEAMDMLSAPECTASIGSVQNGSTFDSDSSSSSNKNDSAQEQEAATKLQAAQRGSATRKEIEVQKVGGSCSYSFVFFVLLLFLLMRSLSLFFPPSYLMRFSLIY